MSMRVLLCGVLPKPRLPAPSKALIFGVGAAAAGVTASVALKEHCTKHPDQCQAAGEAHHIVPRGENRMWAREFAESARESLAGCVDLDSAENGVYLPANENGSCRGRYHRGLHTKKYYSEIAERLELARTTGGCRGVSDELSNIKTELSVGP